MAQLGECLPGLDYTSNPSIWQVEAGETDVRGYLWLHEEFKASLGYMGPVSKINESSHE